MKFIKKILFVLIAVSLTVSCSVPIVSNNISAVAFADEAAGSYTWQGLGNPDSPANINQILLKEPGADRIEVVHTAQGYDDYYENRITAPVDGSKGVSFTFAMSSGMGNFMPSTFNAKCMNHIKILHEDRSVAAEYDSGNGSLHLNEELSHGKTGDDKSSASVVIEVDKGILPEGSYILQFDKDVCGNNTMKILGVPIEFHFELEVVPELAEMLNEVNDFIGEIKTFADGEQSEPGAYPESALTELQTKIDKAAKTAEETDPENEEDKATRKAAAAELYNAFKAFKEQVVVKVSAMNIAQPGESVFVGDTGTAKVQISVIPDEEKYKSVAWSVSPEDGCISINSETGEWSAKYAGSADIIATSDADGSSVVSSRTVTVKDRNENVAEIYIGQKDTLESLVEKRFGIQPLEKLKVYTASGVTLSAQDIEYINGMSGLVKLDLFKADCSEIKLANSSLQTVILPESITTVGKDTLSGCTGLQKIEIPASVKSISCEAFAGCTNLSGELSVWGVTPPELTERDSISGNKLFIGCNISSIKVPYKSSEDYKNAEGWNCGIDISEADIRTLELKDVRNGTLEQRAEEELETTELDDSSIDRVIIKTGDSYLEWQDIQWLRTNCLNATELDLSMAAMKDSADATESKIKANTFVNRVALKTVRLPDPIESISQSAFAGCVNLSEVEFPGKIGKINDGAFRNCKKLPSTMYLGCVDPPDIEGNPFDLETVNAFVVPVQSVEQYKSSNGWKNFEIIPDISITLDKESMSLELPDKGELTVDVKTYNGDSRTIYWYSDNTNVVDLEKAEGITNTVIAKKSGTATITIKDSTGAAQATCRVTVRNLPAPSISVASASYNSVKVSWSGVGGAQKYQLFRCDSRGNTTGNAITLNSAVRNYTFAGLATGTTYYYKVRAFKTVDGVNYYGDYSPLKAGVPTLSKPSTPTVSKSSRTAVKVKWKGISGETGYQVYRATSLNGKYSRVKSVKMASSLYPYAKIKTKRGKTYYYKVRAYKNIGGKTVYSSFSTPKKYKLK